VPRDQVCFRQRVEALVRRVREGEAVVIHCRAGIGRSAMVAACLAGHLGMASSAAFKMITRVRGCPVPDTDGQREWAERYGREVMG